MKQSLPLIPQPAAIKPDRCKTDERQPLPDLAEIVKKPRASAPIYGIYSWGIDYPTYSDAIREIGFKCLRTGGKPFTDAEFTPIARDGLDTMITVGCARGQFDSDEAFVRGNIDNALEKLRRYGPGGTFFQEHPELPYHPIRYIEIFNEPNFGYMVPNSTDFKEKVRLYTLLQTQFYAPVKAAFPEVQIVGFGAGGASAADVGFITACCEENPDIFRTMDILSTHPYVDPIPPFTWMGWLKYSIASGYERIRDLLRRGGVPAMPVWYTELGWFIRPDEGGFFPTCEKGNDKIEQAALNTQVYALGMRLGVERITTMYIMDTDNCNPGFVDRDGTLRPSALAVRNMIRLMPDPKLVGALLDGEDNRYAYVFESAPGGEEVVMVFHADAPAEITIPWAEPTAEVTDMLGNTVTVEADGGHLTLDAGPCPLYIRHCH